MPNLRQILRCLLPYTVDNIILKDLPIISLHANINQRHGEVIYLDTRRKCSLQRIHDAIAFWQDTARAKCVGLKCGRVGLLNIEQAFLNRAL